MAKAKKNFTEEIYNNLQNWNTEKRSEFSNIDEKLRPGKQWGTMNLDVFCSRREEESIKYSFKRAF